ncbi:MAG: DUF1822 family protein [Prochloraceae cyanobacterium]|nr:DUF1822 family protein [Prochloraceae cyanobacterium]
MNNIVTPFLTVPLTVSARDRAREFAAQQATPEKGLRVYLNTLAVWAVHRYLKWLQIDTDVDRGDSWHPGLRAIFDVADLVISNGCKLECRPILEGETEILIPKEVSQNRIGYVVVKFSDRAEEVQLLGYFPTIAPEIPESISINDLQPLDELLELLTNLENQTTKLSQWLQNIFDAGWQKIEDLLAPQTPALAFRSSSVKRAKLIELGSDRTVVLLVSLKPESDRQLGINLRVSSTEEQIELPSQLKLRVITETGQVFREITSNLGDTFMQYEFSGHPGEKFSLTLGLEEDIFREEFEI